MNNLHRELAPISDAAWSQIEEETTRTLKRYLAGRRVVDVPSPGGIALPGVATGHLKSISAPGDGITANQREVKALVELQVPFELSRQTVDDVERGSNDSDWQPAKDAAKKLAFAEDRAIFDGYPAAGIQGDSRGHQQPHRSPSCGCARLSGCGGSCLEPVTPCWSERPLFGRAGSRRIHGPRGNPRSRIPGPRTRQTHRGWQSHLGAGDRGRVCPDHPEAAISS